MTEDGEDGTLDRIYDALDRGDYEGALDLAGQAIEQLPDGEEDPVLRFLAGVALMELDQPEQACEQLAFAVEADPEDPEFRANLALAAFRCCRFEQAEAEARRALASEGRTPEAHVALALALERRGRIAEADRHFAEASKLDPEGCPAPLRLERAAFEREVVEAESRLPAEFRRHLAEVAVTVEDLPREEILREGEPPLDPELLGLFVGVSLGDRSHLAPGGDLPPRILLFQRNLERCAETDEKLREEIAVTLYHELGHYLGLDEAELEEIDLG